MLAALGADVNRPFAPDELGHRVRGSAPPLWAAATLRTFGQEAGDAATRKTEPAD